MDLKPFCQLHKDKKIYPCDREIQFIISSLQDVIYFKKLDIVTIHQIARKMFLTKIDNTHVLFQQDEVSPQKIYVVYSGSFHIMSKYNKDIYKFKKALPGSVIGILEFFSTPINQYNIIANENSKVWTLHFNDFIKSKPKMQKRYSIDYTCDISKKIQKDILDKIEVQIQVLLDICPLFNNMNKEDIFRLIYISDFLTYERNVIISSSSGYTKTFFIIERGEADIYIEGQYYKTLRHTDFFGELHFLKKDIKFIVISKTRLNVVAFSEDVFRIVFRPIYSSIFGSYLNKENLFWEDNSIESSSKEEKTTSSEEVKKEKNNPLIEIIFSKDFSKIISDIQCELSEFITYDTLDKNSKITFYNKKELGKGQFGTVYLVFCTTNSKKYAMKCIEKNKKAEYENYIVKESFLTSTIISNFCIRKYASFQDEKYVYIIFQYIPYIFLEELKKINEYQNNNNDNDNDKINVLTCFSYCLKNIYREQKNMKTIHEDVVRFYSACIILGLEYLHKNNIIYRDLKPENIMIDKKGYAILSDFSFIKELKDNDKTYTFCGSFGFMSPELLKGEGYTKKHDLWSLGVSIYFMYTYKLPFNVSAKDSYINIMKRSCDPFFKISFPSYISSELQDLILGLLSHDPEKRPCFDMKNNIKKHPFFKSINWNLLANKSYYVNDLRCVRRNLLMSDSMSSIQKDSNDDSKSSFDDF